jgi:murein DD-endopeptidase MepM/ murein hydrolase activator NlpD
MRRLIILLLAVTIAVPSAAAAGEIDTPGPPPLASLDELTRLVDDYIAELTHVPLFGIADGAARRQAMVAGVDLFIGSIRAEAIRYVDTRVPEPVRTAVNALPGAASLSDVIVAVNGAAADPVSTWLGQETGVELVELRAALDRLRALVADNAPERVCPVEGPVVFGNDWGDGRPGERTHKGNDLHAPLRTPVVAIEDGVVVQANYHYAGGRQIYVRADSTGDVYYYAHLDYWAKWIWTGTRVEAGDVIGLLGRSGNADVAHLHFGWMPASDDVDLENLQNPYPLLLEICS